MNIMPNKNFVFLFFFIFACGKVLGDDFCRDKESVVISFSTASRNNLSVCKSVSDEYLVYRYGKVDNYFQYPKNLDHKSWSEFSFSGMMRPGGKANAGFGDYDLTFYNGGYEYSVFQTWDDEASSYEIGISVRNLKTKRVVKIKGIADTQNGSLVLLDGNKKIKNTAFDE